MTPSIATILRALAELAPAVPDRVLDVTRGGQPLVWLRDPERGEREADLVRLAAVDLLHSDARILRRAWGMVAGAVAVDGVVRKVRLPLLSEPVRLERAVRGYRVVSAGDLEVTPLVEDRELAARLESAPGLGSPSWLSGIGTTAWLQTVAEAAGLAVAEVVRPGDGRWPPRPPAQGLRLYAAAALYTVRDVFGVAIADGLRAWAGRPDVASTALAAVYGVGGSPVELAPAADAAQVLSPLPLTATQLEVVRRARTEMVSVVSGPPGNGKSHAVVAAAAEVIDRGGSVLVATQSAHAAEVLGALLSRYPGPTPVLFGDAERRAEIATSLAQGSLADRDEERLRAADAAVAAAVDQVRRLSQEVSARLELELRAASLPWWEPFLGGLLRDVPQAFEAEAELSSAVRLLRRVEHLETGGWRRALALRRLRRRLGAGTGVPLDRLRDALEAASAQQAVARLAATNGLDPGPVWSALFDAEAELAAAVGAAMHYRARSSRRWDGAARRSAAALATALQAGRNRRRELLAALDGRALVQALPLWVGTVADVEDLLPPVPGLFDLVIIDEASHTDQIRAAPVLARARRALIVGDPRQLRFVSFVADVDVAAMLTRHGLDDRLDVRRVSTFDLAAGAAPVVWLEEHFRSVPQLIGFSARRFYADRIAVATRHPRTDGTAAIEVRRVPAGIVAAGVHRGEVAAAVATVRELAGEGWTSIGVVTPFRSQADALELALVEAFTVAEIEKIKLRVGTVHSYQGSEADVVVVSLAVSEAEVGRMRFLANPNLFNVMVTRARRRLVLLTSLDQPGGLVGEYLDYAAAPLSAPAEPAQRGTWTGALARELEKIGLTVRCRYPVGRWTVDLCVGEPAWAVGLICEIHPDGLTAHLDRQRALVRAGWRMIDAFASRWNGDPVRAALEIAVRVTPGP